MDALLCDFFSTSEATKETRSVLTTMFTEVLLWCDYEKRSARAVVLEDVRVCV